MGNTLAMSLKAVADSNGDFLLNINTEGVPTGEFLIATGEIEKIIRIVSAEELTPTPTLSPQKTTKPFLIPGFELIECIAAIMALVASASSSSTNVSIESASTLQWINLSLYH